MPKDEHYSPEPENGRKYTEDSDQFYSRFAGGYDWLVKTFPVWRNWIKTAIPWIQGPKVLEISFGTGCLLSQYADRFTAYGVDYNRRLAQIAKHNLQESGFRACLQVANVEALPYADGSFDTVLNTMAFTGYPDGKLALSELSRVLRPGGRLVMVDVNYPSNGNWAGRLITNGWKAGGDIIRDMPAMFAEFGFEWTDEEVGGFGSVHLYVAKKP
jgi:ubiquinone/menaquinone biosynthesis C-methylase UbiE